MTLNKLKDARGFTLIELMIVVAIIGILAAIAIPNFLKYQLRSRRTEGSVNVAAIRTAQIAYFGTYDQFVPAGVNPATVDPGQRTDWDRTGDAANQWKLLGYEPEGQVYYQYQAQVGEDELRSTFLVSALADLDGNAEYSCWLFAKPVVNSAGAELFDLTPPTNCDPTTELDEEGDLKPIELANHMNKVFLFSGEERF